MHPGLKRILDLVRVNPQDSLLVDRFLILASDLKEEERSEVTLGLSEALLRKNPSKAIDLAYMVYKARPGDYQPLEIMVEGFENLGRYGKATVLRQQLDKVKKARTINPGSMDKVVNDSIVAIDRELLMLAQPPAPKIHKIHKPAKKSSEKEPVEEGKKIEDVKKPEPEPERVPEVKIEIPSESVSTTGSNPWKGIDLEDIGDNFHRVAHPTVPEAVEFKIVDDNVQPFRMEEASPAVAAIEPLQDQTPVEEESISFTNKDDAVAEDNVKVSEKSVSFGVPGIPAYLENDFEFGNPYEIKRKDPNEEACADSEISEDKPASKSERSKKVRLLKQNTKSPEYAIEEFEQCVVSKNWEGAWKLIERHWSTGGYYDIMIVVKNLRAERIDLRFMGWWLDTLIKLDRPFQAYAEAKILLHDQPHIAFARSMFPRIQAALAALGKRKIDWHEHEGVIALLKKLSPKTLDSPGSLAVFSYKKKAS